jgi:uncharacterized protein YyaL (SSP411 family)
MANALTHAASPYLRQHAENPVDWVEWGDAAFAEARRRGVPVLVSIGYATCHWCHVMAHECFEDPAIAAEMNARFVNVKVDREELPEVDAIYLDALQALTGRGGWPLNAFVDHDGRPFFALTYAPPPRWMDLLRSLSDLWQNDRPRLDEAAAELTGHLREASQRRPAEAPNDLGDRLSRRLSPRFDTEHPGFGRAPKFPPSQLLQWLLAAPEAVERGAEMVEGILEAMQDGGIHDRVGGGFHRYSTDREWRVPHFEKMLYDNAQLAVAYAQAGGLLGRPDFTRTAVRIGEYLLRDMRVEDADGRLVGYATAEDADDAGPRAAGECAEGGYYALPPTHLAKVVGPGQAERLAHAWDLAEGAPAIGPSGHLEPVTRHIPHPRARDLAAVAASLGLPDAEALRATWEPLLPALRRARDAGRRPIRDDKVLTDLNGLVLSAFATLGRLAPAPADRARFTAATRELEEALAARHPPEGLLRLGAPSPRPGVVTDYGLLAVGLIDAYRVLRDPNLIVRAARLVDEACARLGAEGGGFFMTPADRADLVLRAREDLDGPHPSGQHALALAASRLEAITGEPRWRAVAEGVVRAQAERLGAVPEACATLGLAVDTLTRGAIVVVVAGQGRDAGRLLSVARASANPRVFAVDATRAPDWETTRMRQAERATAWVCEGMTCHLPTADPDALAAILAGLEGRQVVAVADPELADLTD